MDLYLRLDGREVWRDVPAFSSGRGVHSGGRVRFVDIAAELEAAKREKLEESRKNAPSLIAGPDRSVGRRMGNGHRHY